MSQSKTLVLGFILVCIGFEGVSYASLPPSISTQQIAWVLKGTVKDAKGEPLAGVNVIVLGDETRGVVTDFEGHFSIKVSKNTLIEFSAIGMEKQRVTIEQQETLDITMKEQVETLEEVQVVSFGKQKKESVVADISTVTPSDLKIPSSNLTTALAGRIPGLISFQTSGEPGFGGGGNTRSDNANFFVRGVASFGAAGTTPLVLIDGVQLTIADLARLQPDDIQTFSVMKDASAVSIYGAQGANGVIYITTKTGVEGPPKFMIRQEVNFSMPTTTVETADPITFMKDAREAYITRDPLNAPLYSLEKIEGTISGKNPLMYPQNNWLKEITKPYTVNTRTNFNMSGGGKVSQYYISLIYTRDNGLLKVPPINNFNNNIAYNQYQMRSNINVNVTETTKVKFNFVGNYDDYTGPVRSGGDFYRNALRADPVRFRPYYEKQGKYLHDKQILFGGASYGINNALYYNPYADLVSGYRESESSKTILQLELEQDLRFITKGLFFTLLGNLTRESSTGVARGYNPFYYSYGATGPDTVGLNPLNEALGQRFLSFSRLNAIVNSSSWFQGLFKYDGTFFDNRFSLNGLLLGNMRTSTNNQANNLQASLPYRNMGVSGRFSLGYLGKYYTEYSFGYNGSERFDANNRFGFFPSLALGWIVSKEEFMKPLENVFRLVKLKASYGLAGNDIIGSETDRFFYLSRVDLNDQGRGYVTGTNFDTRRNGVSISIYENPHITWEIGRKLNLGFELELLNGLQAQGNFFREVRSNILMNRIVTADNGFEAAIRDNSGEAEAYGFDGLLNYTGHFGKTGWFKLMANYTYAASKVIKYQQPDYIKAPWLSAIGHPIGQQWGYIAERLFVDDAEVANSPRQDFGGNVRGGDIKYRDVNKDGVINTYDRVPIGNSTNPFTTYGFGTSAGFYNFDISVFFQGLANVSFWVDPVATAPFDITQPKETGGLVTTNALLSAYHDSHWSEHNQNIYALWPRYSPAPLPNNTQRSTWFMRDGSFVRLKTAECGYSLPKKILNKIKLKSFRVYISGTNLLTFSSFKLWDPEMKGNGLRYPVQKTYNMGFLINF